MVRPGREFFSFFFLPLVFLMARTPVPLSSFFLIWFPGHFNFVLFCFSFFFLFPLVFSPFPLEFHTIFPPELNGEQFFCFVFLPLLLFFLTALTFEKRKKTAIKFVQCGWKRIKVHRSSHHHHRRPFFFFLSRSTSIYYYYQNNM